MQTLSEASQIAVALHTQTETLREILAYLKQPKLGFTDAPTLYPIYANRSNGCLWYTMQDGEPLPLPHAAITGYVTALKFEKVERRGKESVKLQLFLQGDRPYRLESGYDSHFSKCLLCAIATTPRAQLQTQPLTIMPQAGDDESVLFARVFMDGQQVIAPYSDETDWRRVAQMAKEATA